MANRGFFISFESVDGLGKTTQVNRLVDRLKSKGHDVLFTKEPGDENAGSSVGLGIRNLLFRNPTTNKMRPGVADLLFMADHLQNAGDVAEAVEAGKVVVSDRYADSQFAYAAARPACPREIMQTYMNLYGITPDMTVLLVARGVETYRADLNSKASITETGRYMCAPAEDIRWALDRANGRRGAEQGKQEGKAWNDYRAQWEIQKTYMTNLANNPRTFLVNVWEELTIGEIGEVIAAEVDRRLEAKLTVRRELEAESRPVDLSWLEEFGAAFGNEVAN